MSGQRDVTTEQLGTFAAILSRYRQTSGLTQEELAERAGLSARGIQDLERGVNQRPRAHTVRQLADALRLTQDDRALFEQAARAGGDPQRAQAAAHRDVLGSLPAGPLLGRGNEIERIDVVLDGIPEGTGHVLLFSGEAGIGKTRLLHQVAVEAGHRGYAVVNAACEAVDGPTAYTAFVHALSAVPAALPSGTRRETQRIWKQIEDTLRTADDVPVALTEPRLGSASGDLLARAAATVPLVLLLDDLHFADAGSLRLFAHLARAMHTARVLLAGTFRDTRLTEEHTELARVVQSLGRDRLAERIIVRRLSLEETTMLVAATMGQREVSEEFSSFVYRRTKGVPRLIDQLVRSLGGRLELQAEIGAGAMGRVFRAYDHTTDEIVAAKLVLARQEIDLDTLLRFQQEGAVLAKLDHPNIVRIHDTFVEEHASCIIMELLEGKSLGQLLDGGPLPLNRARRLAAQVAGALAYAHSQDIVHRDIKPDNVMVLPDDGVKVTDFGIARILQPDTSLGTIATTGMRMGTPLYMAPEQIEGKKVDGRTDIYALGAMLHHMVTGGPPFPGSDALAVAVKHLKEEPTPPSQVNPAVPADWDSLTLKAMAKDPRRRFQSAKELEGAIDALSDRRARSSPNLVLPRWMLIVAAFCCILVLVALAVARNRSHSTSAQQSRLHTYLSGLTAENQFSGTALVARKGTILMERGYGLANREKHIPNRPMTTYPVGGVGTLFPTWIAALQLERQGKLRDAASICAYLQSCPSAWKGITVHTVLDGTSGLPSYSWELEPGRTPADALNECMRIPVTGPPGGTTNYTPCAVIVMAAMLERITSRSWLDLVSGAVLRPSGMRHTGRVVDGRPPSTLAADYQGGVRDSGVSYNAFLQLYADIRDVYAFNRAYFTGRLLPRAMLERTLAPRDTVDPPDPNVDESRWGYRWQVGTTLGHQVIYFTSGANDFSIADFYFPVQDMTVIVLSNDQQDDVEGIALHLASGAMGVPLEPRHIALAPSVSRSKAIVGKVTVPGGFTLTGSSNAVWVPHPKSGEVVRIDPVSNRIVAHVKVTGPPFVGSDKWGNGFVAVRGDQIWTADIVHRSVDRIDPITNRVVKRIPVGIHPFGVALGGRWLWTGNSFEEPGAKNTVVQVDLRTKRVVAKLTNDNASIGQPFLQLAATPDALWYEDWTSGTIKRVDAATHRVVATVHAGISPSALAVGAGSLWTGNHLSDLVTRINPATSTLQATIPLQGYPSGQPSGDCCGGTVIVGAGAVWAIAGSGARTLVRIDPATNEVTSALTLPQSIGFIAVAGNSIWAQVSDADVIYRVNPKAMP